MADNDAGTDDIYGPIRGFIKDIKDIKSAIRELTKYAGDLEKIGSLTENLNTLERNVTIIEDRLNALEGLVQENSVNIDSLTSKFNDFYSEVYEAFAALDKKIGDLRESVAVESPGVSPPSISESDIMDINDRINALSNAISSLEDSINTVFEPILTYQSESISNVNTGLSISNSFLGLAIAPADGPGNLVSDLRSLIRSNNSIVDVIRSMLDRMDSLESSISGGVGAGGAVPSLTENRVREIASQVSEKTVENTVLQVFAPIIYYKYMEIQGVTAARPPRTGVISSPFAPTTGGATVKQEAAGQQRPVSATTKKSSEYFPTPYTRSTYSPTTGSRTVSGVQPLGVGYGLAISSDGPYALVNNLIDLIKSHNDLVAKVSELEGKVGTCLLYTSPSPRD